MLYYNFNNYEEFKERFGMQENGNGEKSRKNKILLAFIKNRELLHEAIRTCDYSLLHTSDMAELKKIVWKMLVDKDYRTSDKPYKVELINCQLHSSVYETDEYNGLCIDGDMKSIRYINHSGNDRIYKMKAGKFIRAIIHENEFGATLPEQVITYISEEFVQDWQVYASRTLPTNKLFVNDEFTRIYSSDSYAEDSMQSCMVDKGYEGFYHNAVKAKAAYLENEEGDIVARCVIFTEVHETGSDKVWRLAERQYAIGGSDILKRALVDALIRGGHIDGYKSVGAGCGDSKAFVDNEGHSLSDKKFSIECNLETYDPLSYQDSFKYYDYCNGVAYNYGNCNYYYDLASTDGSIETGEYDEYHERYCDSTTYVYVNGEEMTCDSDNLDDFIWIESQQAYFHQDDVVCCADLDDDYFVREDAYYSKLTECYYSKYSALEDAESEYKESYWTYAEFDEEYYENEGDVVFYQHWNKEDSIYEEKSIYVGTLVNLVRNGIFHAYEGEVYNMLCHSKPMSIQDKCLIGRDSCLYTK